MLQTQYMWYYEGNSLDLFSGGIWFIQFKSGLGCGLSWWFFI